MTDKKEKLFPFAWVMLVLVSMAFASYYFYVQRFKRNIQLNLHPVRLIKIHENDTTVIAYINFVSTQDGKMSLGHSYINEALIKLSHAVIAMSNAAGYTPKADLSKAETNANKITREPLTDTHSNNIRKAANILGEALYNLQRQKYPTLSDEAVKVRIAASEIDPDVLTLDQKNKVKTFFSASAVLLKKMN